MDEVLPRLPMRQWVLSFPFPLRFLFASRPEVMNHVLGVVFRLPNDLIRALLSENRWFIIPIRKFLRHLRFNPPS